MATLVTLTGVPGTGKTTTAKAIQASCEARGLKVAFLNDYPYMIKWAMAHEGDESKVSWFMQDNGERNFNINPQAYRELSIWVTKELANRVHELKSDADVIVLESARGAGVDGQRDRYAEELFEPLREALGNAVRYANIEMTVRDHREVRQRMEDRLLVEPNAAPAFVLDKYISDNEGVQSAYEQARPFHLDINRMHDNSEDPATTLFFLESTVFRLVQLAFEDRQLNFEGQRGRQNAEVQ